MSLRDTVLELLDIGETVPVFMQGTLLEDVMHDRLPFCGNMPNMVSFSVVKSVEGVFTFGYVIRETEIFVPATLDKPISIDLVRGSIHVYYKEDVISLGEIAAPR